MRMSIDGMGRSVNVVLGYGCVIDKVKANIDEEEKKEVSGRGKKETNIVIV